MSERLNAASLQAQFKSKPFNGSEGAGFADAIVEELGPTGKEVFVSAVKNAIGAADSDDFRSVIGANALRQLLNELV